MLLPSRISLLAFVFTLALICLVLVFSQDVAGQAQDDTGGYPWLTALYDNSVRYEDFACYEEDALVVQTFFIEHPMVNRGLPICHNNCPVVRCRPVVQIPLIAQKAKVTGSIPIHILVDEEGDVLYARVLGGHPLLSAAARKAACETRFNSYPHHKRQGVIQFYVEAAGFLGIPYTVNQVR